MFFFSYILDFLVDVLSMDLHIDAVFGELILPFLERIIQQFGFEFRGFYREGT